MRDWGNDIIEEKFETGQKRYVGNEMCVFLILDQAIRTCVTLRIHSCYPYTPLSTLHSKGRPVVLHWVRGLYSPSPLPLFTPSPFHAWFFSRKSLLNIIHLPLLFFPLHLLPFRVMDLIVWGLFQNSLQFCQVTLSLYQAKVKDMDMFPDVII